MNSFLNRIYRHLIPSALLILFAAGSGIAQENLKSAEKIPYKQFLDNIEQQLPELRRRFGSGDNQGSALVRMYGLRLYKITCASGRQGVCYCSV